MEKRHESLITNRLEEILAHGAVKILWNELYLWYGAKRIAAGTYTNLQDRWKEIGKGKLKCVEAPGGVWLFSSEDVKELGQ